MEAFGLQGRHLSMSHILSLVLGTETDLHKAFHRAASERTTLKNASTFLFSLASEVVYTARSRRRCILTHHQSLPFKILLKCYSFLLLFLYMLDGHLLYVFNGIILYLSCTKINVKHLLTNLQTQRLKK